MTGLTAVSRLTGFVRVLVVTAVLGTTFLGNTYQSANTVPNLLFELMAAGALQAVLVPVLVEVLDRDGRASAERVAGAVLGTITPLLAGAAVLAMAASPIVMRALTAGVDDLTVRSAEQRLGVVFLLFFLPQVVCYGLGLVATGVLHAEQRFTVPAAAPIANNLVVIGAYLVFAWLRCGDGPWPDVPLTPLQVLVLAGGTTLGVVVFTVLPAVAAHRSGFHLRPRWGWRDPAVRGMARTGAWAAVAVALTQALLVVVLVLANAAPGGVVAYQFAFTFFLLPFALFAVPVATALYPSLARAAHQGAAAEYGAALGRGLRVTLLLVVPGAAALAALAWPLVRLTAYGEAARGDLTSLAHALAAFALGLPGYAAVLLFTRASYAQGDARLPALVSAGILAAGAAAMVVLAAAWPLDERAAALATGYAVAYTLGGVVLGVLVRRRAGEPFGVSRAVAGILAAGVAAGVVMVGIGGLVGISGRLGALVTLVVAGLAGLGGYAVVLRLAAGRLRPLLALEAVGG